MDRARAVILAGCIGLIAARGALAAEPISAEGPDFVESPEAMDPGRFQYEIGAMWLREREPPSPTFSTPLLLRYGLREDFELRVESDGYMRQGGRSGAGDTALGIKWHALDPDPARGVPSLGWLLHVDMPSGSSAFGKSGYRPSLRLPMAWELPGEIELSAMPGIIRDTADDGHRFTGGIFGAAVNHKFSERMRAFIESTVAQIAHARDGGVIASWDTGAAWLIGNDAQIGVIFGVAANRNSPRDYARIEWAQRF